MSTDDCRTNLEERFRGEVYGGATFGAMAEACTDPARVLELQTPERLESQGECP